MKYFKLDKKISLTVVLVGLFIIIPINLILMTIVVKVLWGWFVAIIFSHGIVPSAITWWQAFQIAIIIKIISLAKFELTLKEKED